MSVVASWHLLWDEPFGWPQIAGLVLIGAAIPVDHSTDGGSARRRSGLKNAVVESGLRDAEEGQFGCRGQGELGALPAVDR